MILRAFVAPALVYVSLTATSPVLAFDFFASSALPQAQTNSCQSQAAMIALAALRDPAFPLVSFDDVRRAEAEFSRLIEAQSWGRLDHRSWTAAMEAFTQGRYTFTRSYPTADFPTWIGRVENLTGPTSMGNVLTDAALGRPTRVVLTSVLDLDGSRYGDGHIVAVLGIEGTGLDSSTEVVVFNGAIKGGVGICEPGNLPGDDRYAAGLIATSDIVLKGFPNNFAIMTISPK